MKTLTTLVMIVFATQVASADDITGVGFVAQPVRAPVSPARVLPIAPFVPDGVGEQTGDVLVGPDRAAALWLDALDVIRVRGEGPLKFARVVGAAGTRAQLAESGVAVARGVTYLAQPPGAGNVWMIWAERSATIHIERPIARDGRLVWDTTQRELLAWVDRGGARPALPVADGAYVAALELDSDAAVGAALEAAYPSPAIKTAVRAWRKAQVVAAVTAVRPLVTPQLRVDPLDALAGMTGDVSVPDPSSPDPRPYRRVSGPHTYDLELDGPGVLRIEARALLPAPQAGISNAPELPDVGIAVTAAGQQLGRRAVAAAYATAPDERTPPPPFPTRVPLTSRESDYLGDRVAVSVPLFPGRQSYRIAIDGGALAVRVAIGRRRVRLGEVLGGRDDVDTFLRDAENAIDGEHSPGAELVRHLVAVRSGAPDRAALPAKLPPLLALAWLVAAGDVRAPATLATARHMLASAKGEVWPLVLELARRVGDGDAVRELYRAAPGAPPASLIPELLALLPRSTPLERIRNWPLAAAQLAARTRPLDPTAAAAARARWRTGEWAQLRPTFKDPDSEPPQPRRFLVEATPQPLALPRAWQVGDLTRLEPKRARQITALPAAVDPARAALVDVFLATSPSDPGPVEVTVDGHPFYTLGLAPIERVQVAVPPGKHDVAIAGPAALRGWVSHVPTSSVGVADRARVQSLWPAEVDGARLSYALPAGELPIEITVRAVGAVEKPIRVTIRSDMGKPVELTLAQAALDTKAYAFDGDKSVTGEARFVIWPATGARTVWLETAEPSRIVATIATRREAARETTTRAEKPRAAAADLIDRVARASRTLASDPDDVRARASRASDLLDLGEISLAREDLVRMLRVPAARQTAAAAAIEEELFARLDDYAEPTHVSLAMAVKEPIAVGGTLMSSPKPKDRASAIALRTKGPDEALRQLAGSDEPIALAIAARAHAARGDTAAAARALTRLYKDTDRWPVGLEALELLVPTINDRKRPPAAGVIALTYGIAQRVRISIDHPRVRRALVVAAAQSGWDTLTSVSTSAGHESLISTQPILPPAPSVLVREALIASSWPARAGHTLTAGNAAVLDLTMPAAANLHAQVHCVRTRDTQPTRAAAGAPCQLTARLDNGTTRQLSAPIGKPVDIPLQQVSAGRHVVEVALAAASEGDAASVRFTSERALDKLTEPALADGQFPIRIERRAKLFVANASTPVTATVQGPTTLWVQARMLGGGAKSADVVAMPKTGAPVRASLALPSDRDADARGDGRELAVANATDVFLVLPDAQPYQIAVKPDRGEILARMALRDERRGKIPRLPAAWYLAAPLAAPPFAIATPPAAAVIDAPLHDEPSAGRVGTFSIDAIATQDAEPEEDLGAQNFVGRLESGVTYRRALSPQRFWWNLRVAGRARENTAPIATARTELYLDQLPLGTTFSLDGAAYTQRYSDGQAWHVRGHARLMRRFALGGTLTLLPALGFAASYMNTTPAIAMVAMQEVDPDVYSDYRYAHRLGGSASIALRWMPLQDFVASLSTTAVTNADFASLDHVGVAVGARTLLPLPLPTLLDLGYRPNYRLADADRMDAYLRHDLSARVETTLWTTTQGRFVLAVWDTLYVGGVDKNAVGAMLRFDLTRHRGLADFTPNDAPFASLVEGRCYAPLEAR